MGNSPSGEDRDVVEAIMTWEQATAAYQFGMPTPTISGSGPIMTEPSTGLSKRSPASTPVLRSQLS